MKIFRLFLISIFLTSCSWFESDYEKLMAPIIKIKLAEKIAGKPNPVFDGITEPDFPNTEENNKTLEGIDSNHDGVRDDLEIWINRIAEDEYVRWAMKDYYKKSLIMYKAFEENQAEPVIHKAEADVSNSAECWAVVSTPYEKEFIKKYNKDPREMTSSKIREVILNSQLIKSLDSKMNNYQISGALGGDSQYCKKSKVSRRYYEILKAN